MKKFKEYGLRKLNSIINFGDLLIFTKTPTIADDDCYLEAGGYIEYEILNEYKMEYILDGDIYIHHYTDEEDYIGTYKFRPTKKDIEELELEVLCDKLRMNKSTVKSILSLGEDEYEEDNE